MEPKTIVGFGLCALSIGAAIAVETIGFRMTNGEGWTLWAACFAVFLSGLLIAVVPRY